MWSTYDLDSLKLKAFGKNIPSLILYNIYVYTIFRRVIVDDANPKNHQKRLAHYKKQLLKDMQEGYEEPEDKILPGGLKVPGRIWQRLYKYGLVIILL